MLPPCSFVVKMRSIMDATPSSMVLMMDLRNLMALMPNHRYRMLETSRPTVMSALDAIGGSAAVAPGITVPPRSTVEPTRLDNASRSGVSTMPDSESKISMTRLYTKNVPRTSIIIIAVYVVTFAMAFMLPSIANGTLDTILMPRPIILIIRPSEYTRPIIVMTNRMMTAFAQ